MSLLKTLLFSFAILILSPLSLFAQDASQPTFVFSHGDNQPVYNAQWSADSRYLATWTDSELRVWSVVSGEQEQRLAYESEIKDVLWSPVDERLAIRTDNDVEIRDLKDSESPATTLQNDDDDMWEATVMQWNRAGTRLLVDSALGWVRLFDAQNGKLLLEVSHCESCQSGDYIWGVWNADETHLLTWTGSSEARIWDVDEQSQNFGRVAQRFSQQDAVGGASWNADESQVITWSDISSSASGELGNIVHAWDAKTGKLLWSASSKGSGWGAAFSPDYTKFLDLSDPPSGPKPCPEEECGTPSIHLLDANQGGKIFDLAFPQGIQSAAIFTSDGQSIVVSEYGDTPLQLVEVSTGEITTSFSKNDFVKQEIWSPDGKWTFTYDDGKIALWPNPNADLAPLLPFQNNGGRIATWNADHTQLFIRSWDMVDTGMYSSRDGVIQVWKMPS